MRFLDVLLETLAPTRCAGCEFPGVTICASCDRRLPRIDTSTACIRCGAPLTAGDRSSVRCRERPGCVECRSSSFSFSQARAFGSLRDPLSRFITLHKDGGDERLGDLLGSWVCEAAGGWEGWVQCVVPVPPSPAALRRRGRDHASAIAKAAAKGLDAPFASALRHLGGKDQRRLGREQRIANMRGSFASACDVPDRVLLVDDVLTTGVTADAAAKTLLAAGAREVRVAVAARAHGSFR